MFREVWGGRLGWLRALGWAAEKSSDLQVQCLLSFKVSLSQVCCCCTVLSFNLLHRTLYSWFGSWILCCSLILTARKPKMQQRPKPITTKTTPPETSLQTQRLFTSHIRGSWQLDQVCRLGNLAPCTTSPHSISHFWKDPYLRAMNAQHCF